MRIAYVCYWSVYRNDGVAKKITMQTGHWRAAGHEVEVFALSRGRTGAAQAWPARPFCFAHKGGRTVAALRLLLALRRFRPDVVYLRYDLLPPPLLALPRMFTTVVELNSDEHAEYRHRRGGRAQLAEFYGRLNWSLIFRPAAGIVSVTNELVSLVERYGRPTIVIANGVDLAAIEPLPATAAGRPTLAFSCTPGQQWHGVDKLLALAAAAPGLDILLLGVDAPPGLPPNVLAPGYLDRAAYEPLLGRADAALGSAALHRNGMREASPLKVREYLAYGLPVILPYEDTDLAGLDRWYLLRLPNDEDNLSANVPEIESFVASARGRRVPREEIASRIGGAGKEARRLAFLGQISEA